ncbi:MAG: hypothetical protein ACXW4A_09650 [Nitrospira sp.]
MTYRDFPIPPSLPRMDETSALPGCHEIVQFSYGLGDGGTYQWTYHGLFSPIGVAAALEDALQRYAGCSSSQAFVYTSMRPGTEVVVSVQEKPYPWHWYGEYLGWISSKLYLVLPFYINEGGWEFSYSVNHQNVLRKTYKYEITARQLYWILLLPFSWINVFTYSLEDAVKSTTAQFVVDAQREGYLGMAH